jgi:hypothetical protein
LKCPEVASPEQVILTLCSGQIGKEESPCPCPCNRSLGVQKAGDKFQNPCRDRGRFAVKRERESVRPVGDEAFVWEQRHSVANPSPGQRGTTGRHSASDDGGNHDASAVSDGLLIACALALALGWRAGSRERRQTLSGPGRET